MKTTMYKKLILESFEKAKSETGHEKPSSLSKHISDVLLENYNFQVNERTLRNYYNEIEKNDGKVINISKSIANELTKYLGYDSIIDFSKKNKKVKKNKTLKNYIIGILIVFTTYFGFNANQKKCMIWNNDHYEKISCEEENAKPIDNRLLKLFKKIEPNHETIFFNKKGDARIWYYKNEKGDLELFTGLGLHPETGKTLKPITQYMIDKYL